MRELLTNPYIIGLFVLIYGAIGVVAFIEHRTNKR